MAESQGILESAVIVPETEDHPVSTPIDAKRRLSSACEADAKRPKLSESKESAETPAPNGREKSPRRVRRDDDERKRGKRLFGGLIGTLSQNSSSAVQKRRSIDKKQQEKLKQQAEENNQIKKQRLDNLMGIRREEQEKFKVQSMHIRHSNMVASARFLKTKAEPQLYYKPWQLSPDEEAKINSQIESVDAAVKRELAEHEDSETKNSDTKMKDSENEPTNTEAADTVGDSTNSTKSEPAAPSIKKTNIESTEPKAAREGGDGGPKANLDDGVDDMVEGEEDTVIY